jgi:hypothetical protein
VDSQHFRRRAAEARALAKLGQDAKLASLLLEVAQDLDAEADVIDAGIYRERRDSTRFPAARLSVSLRPLAADAPETNVELLDLSVSGARVRGDATPTVGTKLYLELRPWNLSLAATVMRATSGEVALAFADDPETAISARFAVQHLRNELARTLIGEAAPSDVPCVTAGSRTASLEQL